MTEVELLRLITGAIVCAAFSWKYGEMLFETENQPRKPLQVIINIALLFSAFGWVFYLGTLANKP